MTPDFPRLFREADARTEFRRKERNREKADILRRWSSPEPIPVIDSPSVMFWLCIWFAAFVCAGYLAAWVMG